MLKAIPSIHFGRLSHSTQKRLPLAKPSLALRTFSNEPNTPVRYVSPLIRFQYLKGARDHEGEGLVRRLRGKVRLFRKQAVKPRAIRKPDFGGRIKLDNRRSSDDIDGEWDEPLARKNMTALNHALIEDDLEAVRLSYKPALPLISCPCTKGIAQLLHQTYRQATQKDEKLPSLLEFALEMISDLKSGKLAPQPWAVIHLLGFFKESARFQEGVDLWNFVADKDNRYIVPSTYGAMIELLADRGDSLASLEELYKLGLNSSDASFAQYHFAPNALVHDRSKQSNTQGLPLTLLQGIYVARLKNGDVQNAYLALDTILRLAPESIPHRFFHLPIFIRPALEGYVTFILACRMGINIGPGPLRILLSKMNQIAEENTTHYWAIRKKQNVLRAMLNAVVSFSALGGQLTIDHQRALNAGIRNTIWNKAHLGYPDEHAQAAKTVESMLFAVAELFSQQGVPPDQYAFSSMIIAASRAGISTVDAILQNLSSLNLDPNVYAYQAILLAAGDEKEVDLIQQTWQYLREMPHDNPRSHSRSWWSLARACKFADCTSFAKEQMERGSDVIDLHAQTKEDCLKILEEPEGTFNPTVSHFKFDQPEKIIDSNLGLHCFIVDSIAWLKSEKLFTNDLPYTFILGNSLRDHISDEYQQAIYDTLTAESTFSDSQPDVNVAGIPLDRLRFENWKSINELIYEATRDQSQKNQLPMLDEEKAKDMISQLRGLP